MTVRLDDVAARATAASLDALLEQLEALPDSDARTAGFEIVDALMQLYGEGLARLLAAHREGRLSDELLGTDEVLVHLLAIHDLVPRSAQPPPLVQLERKPTTRAEGEILPELVDAQTQCQLCAAPIASDHRHLIDTQCRELVCACAACAILFDGRAAAGSGRYRLVPRRYRSLDDLVLEGGLWERLELPVDIAFMFMSSSAKRPVAFYPGPMGTTESALPLPAWDDIVARTAALATLEPDVEAVLVRRTRGARDFWLVPVDECYRLAGAMRATWEGISGGDRMRAAVDAFFRRLAARDESRRERPAVVRAHVDEPVEASWSSI